MTFISEEIPEPEKARIDWKKFAEWITCRAYWTIDRARNAFLVELSAGPPDGEPPIYGVSWDGDILRVYARPRLESAGNGDAVHWAIQGFGVSSELREKLLKEGRWAPFMAIVKEALIAHGRWLYKTQSVDVI